MINMVLLAIIIILLIVCLVLLYLLLSKDSKKVKVNQPVVVNNVVKEKYIDIQDLEFPKKITSMGHHLLTQSCLKVFDSFKFLDYANKNEKVLNNIEWHSWQVSLLLSLIQRDGEFFIPKPQQLIHNSISNKPMSYIENYMQRIFRKYENSVNIDSTRDILSNDVIWSVKEVSVIFYYMANLKKH